MFLREKIDISCMRETFVTVKIIISHFVKHIYSIHIIFSYVPVKIIMLQNLVKKWISILYAVIFIELCVQENILLSIIKYILNAEKNEILFCMYLNDVKNLILK